MGVQMPSTSLALLALLAGTAAHPVQKVVSLLKNLQTDLSKDEKAEQSIYDRYACWCEVTTARKAKSIEDAKDAMQRLGQDTLKLKGTVAVRTDEIAELATQIKDNKEAQEAATTVRAKENAEWQSESAETTSAQKAINTAIGVLSKASTKPTLLQQDATAKLQASVSAAVAAMPTKALSALAPTKLAMLRGVSTALTQASYAPQSATIQGILSDMYTTMALDLQDTTAAEGNRNRAFEDFMAAKNAEFNKMSSMLLKKQQSKAEAASMLAETVESYDDVSKQLEADVDFFDTTKKACVAKTEDWKVRSNLRKEELKGVSKALKILSSDDARKLFAKSIKPGMETNLLQMGAAPKQSLDKLYATLKEKASNSHSLRLASLAAQVRLAKVGHFDAVVKSIDTLVGVLAQEQDSDTRKRDGCQKQYQDIAKESAKLQWKIKKNDAQIQKLKSLIETRSDEKKQTVAEIAETQKDMKEMKTQRKKENGAFLQAKKDDSDAIKLMKQARTTLMEFYKKNAVKLGAVQGSTKLLQQSPAAVFSEKGNRKAQSKGIVSIMTMLIQDLESEITNGVKSEQNAHLSFEKALASAQKLLEKLVATKVSLEGAIAKRNKDKIEEGKGKTENQGDLDDQTKEKKSIATDCDYMIKNYSERQKYRKSEADALTDAKEFLANFHDSPAKAGLLQSAMPETISFAHLQSPKLKN